jgi:hypothetical protein
MERFVEILDVDDRRQRRYLERYGVPRLTENEVRANIAKEKARAFVALDDARQHLALGHNPPLMKTSLHSLQVFEFDCDDHDEDAAFFLRVARPDDTQVKFLAAHPRPDLYVVPVLFDLEGAHCAQWYGGHDCGCLSEQIPILVGARDDQSQY